MSNNLVSRRECHLYQRGVYCASAQSGGNVCSTMIDKWFGDYLVGGENIRIAARILTWALA